MSKKRKEKAPAVLGLGTDPTLKGDFFYFCFM